MPCNTSYVKRTHSHSSSFHQTVISVPERGIKERKRTYKCLQKVDAWKGQGRIIFFMKNLIASKHRQDNEKNKNRYRE